MNEAGEFLPGLPPEGFDGLYHPFTKIAAWTAAEREAKRIFPVLYGDRGDERFYSNVPLAPVFDPQALSVFVGFTLIPRNDIDALAYQRATFKAIIKSEAARRIEAGVPDWRQRNILFRSIELLAKACQLGSVLTNIPVGERAELAAALQEWRDRVKAFRDASNTIEAKIDGLSFDQLKVYNPSEETWPA